jgi:surface carbohydrate biosynthesis protein (TIGR04326 family)
VESSLFDKCSGEDLLLWDSADEPPASSSLTYLWNGYAETDSVFSLLRHVEVRGEHFRGKYLGWIHGLGETLIDGRRLVDHLVLENGFSYWWMTLLVEQSIWKSPEIKDALRLFALEEIIVERRPTRVHLASANRTLHEGLDILCRNLGVPYEWEKIPEPFVRKPSFRAIFRSLPQIVRGLVTLVRDVRVRWPLRKTEKMSWFDGNDALFFCSYLANLDMDAAQRGTFHSYYWNALHGLLNRKAQRTNWLQVFTPCTAVPAASDAAGIVERFNRRRDDQGFHTFVEAHLSWQVVLRVLRRWFKLFVISHHVRSIRQSFRPAGSCLSFWPLMKKDWYASMHGAVAVSNLLWLELFDLALRDIPHQRKGFYLCENQAWERAMVHAWRKHGHGRLIAVPHATVRFWDLRYFNDVRTIFSTAPAPMPQADLVAVNGRVVANTFRDMGFPMERVVECEALRYGHLDDLQGFHSKRPATGTLRVLVLGDYLPVCTTRMMQLLEQAARHVSVPTIYHMKPHPVCLVGGKDFPSLRLEIVTERLGKNLREYDVAFASNLTSAAVDAYLAGLPVVVMLDPTELNLNALRGCPGVRFVSTPEDLAEGLQAVPRESTESPDRNDFFFLDPQLSRWSRLLSD